MKENNQTLHGDDDDDDNDDDDEKKGKERITNYEKYCYRVGERGQREKKTDKSAAEVFIVFQKLNIYVSFVSDASGWSFSVVNCS